MCIRDRVDAVDTAIGRVPTHGSLDVDGLGLTEEQVHSLLDVDEDRWRSEIPLIEEHYDFVGERLPSAMRDELENLEKRLAG